MKKNIISFAIFIFSIFIISLTSCAMFDDYEKALKIIKFYLHQNLKSIKVAYVGTTLLMKVQLFLIQNLKPFSFVL